MGTPAHLETHRGVHRAVDPLDEAHARIAHLLSENALLRAALSRIAISEHMSLDDIRRYAAREVQR
jgi:hypothetical protein